MFWVPRIFFENLRSSPLWGISFFCGFPIRPWSREGSIISRPWWGRWGGGGSLGDAVLPLPGFWELSLDHSLPIIKRWEKPPKRETWVLFGRSVPSVSGILCSFQALWSWPPRTSSPSRVWCSHRFDPAKLPNRLVSVSLRSWRNH